MADYHFLSLSPHDFELLGRDLLAKHLGVPLESFTSGRDKGIDSRYIKGDEFWLAQHKHYARTGYSGLLSNIKRFEVEKVRTLKPSRYLLMTSVGLTPGNKKELSDQLSPFVLAHEDILGRDDVNNLLQQYPGVENNHFKLWLTSKPILDRLIHSEVLNRSSQLLHEIERDVQRYVVNESFDRAMQILNEHRVCIIAGIPGIGKTLLAKVIALHFAKDDFQLVEVSNDIAEAYEILSPSERQFFYYDDFLGQTSLAERFPKNEENRLLNFVKTIGSSSNKYLVLTTREYILEKAKLIYEPLHRRDFELETTVLKLEDYTRLHRAEILYNHLYFSGSSLI